MQFNVATGVGGGNDHGYWQKRSERLHYVMETDLDSVLKHAELTYIWFEQ